MNFDLDEHVRSWEENLAGGVTGHGDQKLDGVFLVYSDSPDHGSAKFISGAWGIGGPLLGDLEKQMKDDHGDWLELEEGSNWCLLTGWDGGETQYGQGYGDTYTIPGYYEYERITPEAAKARIERWHAQELDAIRDMSIEEFRHREEGLIPCASDPSLHRWVGEGDYGGGRRCICGDCGIHIDELAEATRDVLECPGCGRRVGQDHTDKCPTGYSGTVDLRLAELPV